VLKEDESIKAVEKGDIYFFIRPTVGTTDVKGLGDVQRFYIVLNPDEDSKFREVVVGQKKLPDIEQDERYFAYVEKVFDNAEDLKDELGGEEYGTRTRGKREEMPARAVGEGRYVIADHEEHSHIAYVLELPKVPKEIQKDLRIENEGSYIVSVRNPKVGDFRTGERPNYPKDIQDEFDPDNRFARRIDPRMLDYEHTEFILIGAKENAERELGIRFDIQKETVNQSKLVKELKLEKSKKRLEPIEKGEWD
jgi:hypothetical protein